MGIKVIETIWELGNCLGKISSVQNNPEFQKHCEPRVKEIVALLLEEYPELKNDESGILPEIQMTGRLLELAQELQRTLLSEFPSGSDTAESFANPTLGIEHPA